MNAQTSAAKTAEGRVALVKHYQAIVNDDRALMAHFWAQESAAPESVEAFKNAVVQEPRLEKAYQQAEQSYKQVSESFGSFARNLQQSNRSPAARREFFDQLAQKTSTFEGANEVNRTLALASKDPMIWDQFNNNLAETSASRVGSGSFQQLMKNIGENDTLRDTFHGVIAQNTTSQEGLNQLNQLLTRSSDKTFSQTALITNISEGAGEEAGHFGKIMKNVAQSPDTASTLMGSIAQTTSCKEGLANYENLLNRLAESPKDREAFFEAQNKSLETDKGLKAFTEMGANTRNKFKLRNREIATITELNRTESGRKVFSRFMKNIRADKGATKTFLEKLNKMSLDPKARNQVSEFARQVKESDASRNAFVETLTDFTSDKRGKILMSGLLRNDEVMDIMGKNKQKFIKTRVNDPRTMGKTQEITRGSIVPPSEMTSESFRFMGSVRGRSLVSLLSHQTGATQTQAKTSNMFSDVDGMQSPGQQVMKVQSMQQPGMNNDAYQRVQKAFYDGRIYERAKMEKAKDLRMLSHMSSSGKEKVEKIWIELNRRYPLMNPREVYNDAKLRYRMLCRNCGHDQQHKAGLEGKFCGPCVDSNRRYEVLSSQIGYTEPGAYINTNKDVISFSPQVSGVFETNTPEGDMIEIQTTNVLPTFRDMLEASTGKYKRPNLF